jgi:hypothetical protein
MALKFRIPGLLAVLLLLIFCLGRLCWSEPTLAEVQDSQGKPEEQVFHDTAASFALFKDLTEDVQYRRDSVYPVVLKAASQQEAIEWLRQGFSEELARSLASYYLAWDEEMGRLVVIPEESIPILTTQDRTSTTVTFRNERQARLECLYYNCYAPGDCWRYIIETEKNGDRWKVYDLTLEQTSPGQNF